MKYRILLDTPQYTPQGDSTYKFPRQTSISKAPRQLNPAKLTREDRIAIEEYMQGVPVDSIIANPIGMYYNADGSIVINYNFRHM